MTDDGLVLFAAILFTVWLFRLYLKMFCVCKYDGLKLKFILKNYLQ